MFVATSATATPMSKIGSQNTVPDSPSSGHLEFPPRRPAASSSEEAANAALLNQTQNDGSIRSATGEIRLQAVLISSADDEQQEAGIKGKLRKAAALGLGQTPPVRSSSRPQPEQQPPNKRRFSLDVLKIPFLANRRPSANSTTKQPQGGGDSVWERSAPGATASERARTQSDALLTVHVDESEPLEPPAGGRTLPPPTSLGYDDRTLPAPPLPSKTPSAEDRVMSPSAEDQGRILVPRSALSRPSSPSRAGARSASAHRVSFSPSTDEAVEAREIALATLAKEEEKRLEQERKAEIKRRKKEEKLTRKKSISSGGGIRLRGLKSFSTGNLIDDITRVTSRDTIQSDVTSDISRDDAAASGYGMTQAPNRRFSLDKRGIRLYGARGKGKAKVAKVKVTKKQAVAARHAKLLEQVINAGMGLHPVEISPPRPDASVDRSAGAKNKKGAVSKPRTVPVASPAQLKELKKALMDVDLANHIIVELRGMKIPERSDSLSHLEQSTNNSASGSRSGDRIIAAAAPDGPAATLAFPARPAEARRPSAAEDALRKLGQGAERAQQLADATTASPAMQHRMPSLAAESSATGPASATGTAAATAPSATGKAAVPLATRPRKIVCLDCDEHEAHRRHVGHQQKQTTKGAGESVGTGVAAGAAAVGVAALTAGAISVGSRPRSADAGVASVAATPAHGPKRPFAMVKSKSSSLLPVLEQGGELLGSTPVQMLISPTSTFIGTAGQMSGAFNALADVSGALVKAASDDSNVIRPPLDRMAIFVHWWGFELTLPEPTMNYLNTAHSVSGAFLSFLQTMAVTGGVPELQPFIKYISVYMDVEFKAIKEQDRGNGVCVAATWLMPLALCPRPFDYPLTGPVEPAPAPTAPGSTPGSGAMQSSPSPFIGGGTPSLPPLSGMVPQSTNTSGSSPVSTPTKPRHAFHKAGPATAATAASAYGVGAAAAAVAGGIHIPQRNLTPTQLAAIQAARTERMPSDLERPASLHSRNSSIDSRDGVAAQAAAAAALPSSAATVAAAGTTAPLTPRRNSIGVSLAHALESVDEVPEGSLRIKAK